MIIIIVNISVSARRLETRTCHQRARDTGGGGPGCLWRRPIIKWTIYWSFLSLNGILEWALNSCITDNTFIQLFYSVLHTVYFDK